MRPGTGYGAHPTWHNSGRATDDSEARGAREDTRLMVTGMRLVVWRVGLALGVLWLAAGAAGAQEMIRVGLSYGQAPRAVVVSGPGEWAARRFSEGFDGEARISASKGELVLETGGRRGGVGPWIELRARDEGRPLRLDGSGYRGTLRVEVADGGGLRVVNEVEMEDYVRGVVPSEMFSQGEAFKVQAVVSRTYAVYMRDVERKHRGDGFDICAAGHCQVYRGAGPETALSDEAVRATAGEVLTYEGRPIFSAYHANAGGMTQGVDDAWPGSTSRDLPYLVAVASPYDERVGELPGYGWCYEWDQRVSGRDIEERLRARGKDVGEVRALTVVGRTSTGRVRELEVVGTRGRATLGTPGEVRAVLGTPSTCFEVGGGGGEFELSGRGRGHGVGLSQHGAFGMARAGHGYAEILGSFYSGVSLAQDYGRGESRALGGLVAERAEGPAETAPEGEG